MKMNSDKTEVQYVGKDAVGIDVTMNGELLKQVKDFVYSEGR